MSECGFDKAWTKPCKNQLPCKEHDHLVCESCGAKATRQCDETFLFVCGASLCATCEHTLSERGTNEGIRGEKMHRRPEEQKYKTWYERELESRGLA